LSFRGLGDLPTVGLETENIFYRKYVFRLKDNPQKSRTGATLMIIILGGSPERALTFSRSKRGSQKGAGGLEWVGSIGVG
jgi:hypothetical protein